MSQFNIYELCRNYEKLGEVLKDYEDVKRYDSWYDYSNVVPEDVFTDDELKNVMFLVENKKSKKVSFDYRLMIEKGKQCINESSKQKVTEALKHGLLINKERGLVNIDVTEDYWTWGVCNHVGYWKVIKKNAF